MNLLDNNWKWCFQISVAVLCPGSWVSVSGVRFTGTNKGCLPNMLLTQMECTIGKRKLLKMGNDYHFRIETWGIVRSRYSESNSWFKIHLFLIRIRSWTNPDVVFNTLLLLVTCVSKKCQRHPIKSLSWVQCTRWPCPELMIIEPNWSKLTGSCCCTVKQWPQI